MNTFWEGAAHSINRMFSLVCLFVALVVSQYGFEGKPLVLIALFPGHCLPLTVFEQHLQIIYVSFLASKLALLLSTRIDSGYIVCTTPPTIFMKILFKMYNCCFLVMVCRYACGLDINLRLFCQFFVS